MHAVTRVQRVIHDMEIQATGCRAVGDYRQFAKQHGFKHIEVANWASSAGDWTFIVSKDGHEWQLLQQTNNFPSPGFSYYLSDDLYEGTVEEVLAQLARESEA